jgi:Fe-S-cluster containining protein
VIPISPLDCPGYCCATYKYVFVTEAELKKIAKYLNLTWRKFKKEYRILAHSETAGIPGQLGLQGRPCPFWQDPTCLIYKVRPRTCTRFALFDQNCTAECREVHNEMMRSQR